MKSTTTILAADIGGTHSRFAAFECYGNGRLCLDSTEARLTTDSEITRRFAAYYDRAAQSYALAVLPTGGLCLTGGVAARNPFLVDHDAFRAEFSACRSHEALLKRIPIFLNVSQESGLWERQVTRR
jgi:glucokinase